FITLSLSLSLCDAALAQSEKPSGAGSTRVRSVTATTTPSTKSAGAEKVQAQPTATRTNLEPLPQREATQRIAVPRTDLPATPASGTINARIIEAQRFLKTRPRQTSLTSPAIDIVTLALVDYSSRIHLLTFSKQSFLTKGTELLLTTSLGT